jgi:hypothetical protein
VETKKSFEVHHYTTKNRQDGVEAEETAVLYVHFSGTVCPIKQEQNGERSYSLDLKR